MTMPLPPAWASNTNYGAGPDTGTPTKVDPSSQADGFIRGVPAAAQEVNYVLNPLAASARSAFGIAALRLRPVAQDGLTITDTARALGAVQRRQDTPLIAVKVDGAFIVSDWGRLHASGALSSITEVVADVVANTTRIVALGYNGANFVANYSDDDGGSWTNGVNLGGSFPPVAAIWNNGKSSFVIIDLVGNTAATANGTALGVTGVTGSDGRSRLAAFASGTMLSASFAVTTITTKISTDTGDNWSAAGAVPNNTDMADSGCVAGNNGSLIYHVGRRVGGATLQVSSTADGTTWTLIATLTPPASATFNTHPTIRMCQNTGLLVVSCTTAGGQTVHYASLGGTDWVGPQCLFPVLRATALGTGAIDSEAISVAGGKILATYGAELFASDGLGF